MHIDLQRRRDVRLRLPIGAALAEALAPSSHPQQHTCCACLDPCQRLRYGSYSCVQTLLCHAEGFQQACRHFAAPWQYDGDRGDAIAQLTGVATGGAFMGGNAMESISNLDAVGYILGGVAAVVQGAQWLNAVWQGR